MSGSHPEKRPFLHTTSDTDSDLEHEREWEGARLANPLGSRSFGVPKHSYVTHDFRVFRAVKVDPDEKQAGNEEPGHERDAVGSSPLAIETAGSSTQASSSRLSLSFQSGVSSTEIRGSDARGRDSYIGSGIRRSLSQQSTVRDGGQAVTGSTLRVSSAGEQWPSVQPPFPGIVTPEGGSGLGLDITTNSSNALSEIGAVREESGGRTSYVTGSGGRTTNATGSERQPLVEYELKEIDRRGGDSGRNSFVGLRPAPANKSSHSASGAFAEPFRGKHIHISNGSESQSLALSSSEIDLLGEGIGGRNNDTNNSGEMQSSLQSPAVESKAQRGAGGGSERWSLPYRDEDGSSAYVGNGSQRQSLFNSLLVDTKRLGEESVARNTHIGSSSSSERRLSTKPIFSDADIRREDADGGGSSVKDPLLDESPSDPLKEMRRASINLGRKGSHMFPGSDNDVHADTIGSRYAGSGDERRASGKERALDEQPESLREMKRVSVISGRRMSRLPSTSDPDRDPESQSERIRGRASVSQSNRRASRVVSPPSEAEPNGQPREREEFGEDFSGADLTPQQGSLQRRNSLAAQVGERVPPEWALLLLGCLLGLATGLSVVLFNKGVHFIHDMAWAGTPKDGAAWFRLQQLIDIWHRVMLIPVVGGVVVGMMHAVVGILDQIKASRPPAPRHAIDWLGGVKPTIKATQAMVTLGTGCSLGPEGPSVDIGKAWAHGLATIMKNNRERRIALVAAGAAAGISAGFNAPVSGMFFAIETVLRPQNAENSPPLTTAMIILASVISSTVSQVLLQETAAFTVPTYELRSAAELPLYLLLGGVCGVVSVIFVRMTTYFTEVFEFLRDRIGIPPTVTPAMGGLVTGLIALRYPGVLYWGFYNVDEILHSGKSATAPGAGLVTQLICAKVVATAFSKGSGLVGGVYAPSLFIGAAVGSVYGTIAGKIINAALPGQDTVAHPQAYALVGMAALLAAVCSVPLTSILLLFELTKDYHILLPLMGGIGVAIWVAAVAKQTTEKHFTASAVFAGRSFQPLGTDEDGVPDHTSHEQLVWKRTGSGTEVECRPLEDYQGSDVVSDAELKDSIKVSQAMSKSFVKVQAIATVKETIGLILSKQQRCALVVDENDLLEGIFSFSDLEREVMRAAESSHRGHRMVVDVETTLVAAFYSGKGENQDQDTDLVVCFPDMSLRAVIEIMDSSGFKQLPVVARAGKRWQDEGRQIVGLIDRDAIPRCVRAEASKRITAILTAKNEEDDDEPLLDGH